MAYEGKCPVPRCEHKDFIGVTYKDLLLVIKQHIIANLADPNHSDIAEMEGWLEDGQ